MFFVMIQENERIKMGRMSSCDFACGPEPAEHPRGSTDRHLHVSSRSEHIQFTRPNKLTTPTPEWIHLIAANSIINMLLFDIFMVENIINMPNQSDIQNKILGVKDSIFHQNEKPSSESCSPSRQPYWEDPQSPDALSQMLFLSKLENERKVKLSDRESLFSFFKR